MDDTPPDSQPTIPASPLPSQDSQKLHPKKKDNIWISIFVWIGVLLFIGFVFLASYAVIGNSNFLLTAIPFAITVGAVLKEGMKKFQEIKGRIQQSFPVGGLVFLSFLIILPLLVYTFPAPSIRFFPPLRRFFPPSHTIHIGIDMPLSGTAKTDGEPIANGAHFAIDQANKSNFLPGYVLKPVDYDDTGPNDMSNADVGVEKMKAAIDDGLVAAIVGPMNSIVAVKTIPVTNQAPIALISPSTSAPCLTKIHDPDCANRLPDLRPTGKTTFFRLSPPDYEIRTMVQYLRKEKSYNTAYVVYDVNDVYSNEAEGIIVKEWQATNGTFVAPAANTSAPGSINGYEQLLKQLPTAPDVIFFAGTRLDSTYLRQAMANIPSLNQTAFVGGGTIVDDQFISDIGSLGGGPVFGSTPFKDILHGQFRIDYQNARYDGYRPDTASAYDCALIVITAIKAVLKKGIQPPSDSWDLDEAKVFRQEIINEIAKINYPGVTGTQQFDADGDSKNIQASIYQLINGTWVFLESGPSEITGIS